MESRYRFFSAGLLCLGLLDGCTGTEFGNPSAATQMSFGLVSSDEDEVIIRPVESAGGVSGQGGQATDVEQPLGPIVVEEAWIVIEKFQLLPCGGSEPDDLIPFEGPFVFDLAAETPNVFTFPLQASDEYCLLHLHARHDGTIDLDGLPVELEHDEFFLKGQTPRGAPLTLSWNDIERRLRFPIEDGYTGGGLTVRFDAVTWFDGVDIASALSNGDGVVALNEEENSELFEAFTANFTESVMQDSDSNPGAIPIE